MIDASSVTKLFIPPSDRRLRRTTTSKLPSERVLNQPQIPGHTNYARSVRQPVSSNTGLRFSHEMTVATIGPFKMFTVCNRHEFHDLVTTQVLAKRNPPINYTHTVVQKYTGLFISPSGISELDSAATKTDTAERSMSIGRESLQVFFVLGVLTGSTARG
jgi:hypothetical protein